MPFTEFSLIAKITTHKKTRQHDFHTSQNVVRQRLCNAMSAVTVIPPWLSPKHPVASMALMECLYVSDRVPWALSSSTTYIQDVSGDGREGGEEQKGGRGKGAGREEGAEEGRRGAE